MLSRPPSVSDGDIVHAIAEGWGLALASVEWRALGFGSHHWLGREADGRRWFVTVNDLDHSVCDELGGRDDTFDRLGSALGLATRVRRAGRSFVIAPTPAADGTPVRRLRDRYAVALYEWVDGTAGSFGPYATPDDAADVLDLLVELHECTTAVTAAAPAATGQVPRIRTLLDAGGGDARRAGPFAERVARLLGEHADVLEHQVARHDRLWQQISAPDRLVVTHGEPHPGNVLRTPSGPRLIDWDTARLAPPERDLWLLVESVPDCTARYEEQTGRRVLDAGLECHRLAWALSDAASAATFLLLAPDDSEDARAEWEILRRTIADLAAMPA